MADEETPGGSRVFRHEARERDLEPTGGDPDLVEAVTNHLDQHFGTADLNVWHEIVSDLVHIDVHQVPPGPGREWVTLVTSGMAERAMTVPDDLEYHRHAELVLALPPDWPLGDDAFEDESNYWPIRLLKQLARLPHEFDTFLYYGHTVPNGDPPDPYAPSTQLCCALITPPLCAPEGFDELTVGDRTIHFFGVVALYADEMQLKLDKGMDALIAKLDEGGVTELVDPARPSVASRRRGFFRR